MINSIEAAAKNFCTHQLGIKCQNIEKYDGVRTFIANLIIGSAKVLAEESENPYDIGTPSFEGIAAFNINYDEIVILSNAASELIIAVKELDV